MQHSVCSLAAVIPLRTTTVMQDDQRGSPVVLVRDGRTLVAAALSNDTEGDEPGATYVTGAATSSFWRGPHVRG